MTAYVLVINAGSCSLKYSLVDGDTGEAPAAGSVEQIGEPSGRLKHTTADGEHTKERAFPTFEDALGAAIDAFEDYGPSQADVELLAVGHRVVHGGDRFSEPSLIDDDLVRAVVHAEGSGGHLTGRDTRSTGHPVTCRGLQPRNK